jgi:heme exporter protein D
MEFLSLIPVWGWVAIGVSCFAYIAFTIAESVMKKKRPLKKDGEQNGRDVSE